MRSVHDGQTESAYKPTFRDLLNAERTSHAATLARAEQAEAERDHLRRALEKAVRDAEEGNMCCLGVDHYLRLTKAATATGGESDE